tara:strand:- start:2015 stop:2521 length:507 start_codon:yes stop_codon:yes gene_type:complete
MGVTTAMCNTFKKELLEGLHDLDNHTIKIALIKASSTEAYGEETKTFDNAASTYSGGTLPAGAGLKTGTDDEASVTGAAYSVTNNTLAGVAIALSTTDNRAYVTFSDKVWATITTSAEGALIYNASLSNNNAIAVFSFGQTVTSTAGDFTVDFPAVGSEGASALIRLV